MAELDLERIKRWAEREEQGYYVPELTASVVLTLVTEIKWLREERDVILANYEARREDIARLCKKIERLRGKKVKLSTTP